MDLEVLVRLIRPLAMVLSRCIRGHQSLQLAFIPLLRAGRVLQNAPAALPWICWEIRLIHFQFPRVVLSHLQDIRKCACLFIGELALAPQLLYRQRCTSLVCIDQVLLALGPMHVPIAAALLPASLVDCAALRLHRVPGFLLADLLVLLVLSLHDLALTRLRKTPTLDELVGLRRSYAAEPRAA